MHHALFVVLLLVLLGVGLLVPSTIGLATIGAIAAIAFWLYVSLRGEKPNSVGGVLPHHDSAASSIGVDIPAPNGPANACADISHGGLGCDAGSGGASHDSGA